MPARRRARAARGRDGPAAAAALAPGCVENARSGQLLASHAASERLPIASITKLMTLIVALGHLKLDQIVTVDPRAAAVGQESVYLTAGEQISVADLVKAALIQSANDAADALALATAPSFPAFAALMNAKARELGLVDTHFVRPDGLDAAGEYSSAHDVTLLAPRRDADPGDRGHASDQQTRDDRRRTRAAHLERPARRVPGRLRGQDRPHLGRRLVPGGRGERGRHDDLRHDPREPLAQPSATPTSNGCSPTGSRSTARSTRSPPGGTTPRSRSPTARPRCALVARPRSRP